MVSSPCGKLRYRTRLAAKIALANIQAKDDPARPKQECRIYWCPSCRAYHLTSRPGGKRRPSGS